MTAPGASATAAHTAAGSVDDPGAAQVRQTSSPRVLEPIDWALATRVAHRVAGRPALDRSYLSESLAADFTEATTVAEALVADFTGLRAPGRASAAVLSRAEWATANVESMRRMLAPLLERIGERMARSPVAAVGRRVAAAEVGFLLGWFSQRVLGQYDVLVPDDDGRARSDAVYYVGANVLALEKRFAFRPRDFRLWIAIHEVTHRAQFTAVPWLADHYFGLVARTFELVEPDPSRIVAALRRAAGEISRGNNPLDDGGLVGLLASEEHRGVLAQIQALMSLLEGHGNRVMNGLGRLHVHGQDRMARVLHERRQTTGLQRFLQQLLGMEAKLRQYEVGETFVAAVEREAGPRGLDPAWRGPELLPSTEELADPTAWLTRVGGLPAVA